MTFAEILAFLFTTPTGLSIVGALVTLLIHGVGVQIPALSPLLNSIGSLIAKLTGDATPTPAPGPAPMPGPMPPMPAGIGQGQILRWALGLAGMLLHAKQTGVVLSEAEQAAVTNVTKAAGLHTPTPPK